MTSPRGAAEVSWPLHVMVIVEDEVTADLMRRIFPEDAPDQLSLAFELADGLARSVSEAPDLVFIDVAMGSNAGLAVVHHLRAVSPDLPIYALAEADSLQLGTQAVSLGGTGLLMMPLSGDEVLTAVAQVRARLTTKAAHRRLERQTARATRSEALVERVADLAMAKTRREASERLADLLVSELATRTVLVYLPAGDGVRQLMRVATRGSSPSAPAFCDELELMAFAAQHELELVRLATMRDFAGVAVLGLPPSLDEGPLPLLRLLAAQATTVLALVATREESHSGTMKDPSTSAYTFAYFVDTAGREIGLSRRHGRRFALATITMEDPPQEVPGSAGKIGDQSTQLVERVLSTVRATDILARVDEREFYLLLPETGGTGAHVARRRLLRQIRGDREPPDAAHRFTVSLGVATYPHNGRDLSQLLRFAKHRAEACRASLVRKLELQQLPLPDIFDTLLWAVANDAGPAEMLDAPRVIELPAIELASLVAAALADARRGGAARVVATQRPGVCLGVMARSALGREALDMQLDLVDVTHAPGCQDLEALTLVAEHGCYALLARAEGGTVRAVHSSDPLIADLITQRLAEASGTRLVD